jgi:hypothetical protein
MFRAREPALKSRSARLLVNRIGGGPTCDVIVGAERAEARVWVSDGRAVLHGLGHGVLVNGEAVGGAVLEDEGVVHLGAETFRFETGGR